MSFRPFADYQRLFYFTLYSLSHRKEPRPLPRQLPCAPTLATSTKIRKVKDDLPPIKRNNMLAIENMILQAIENKYGAEDESKQHLGADGSTENEANGGGSQKSGGIDGESVKQDMDDTFFLTQVTASIFRDASV